VREISPAELLAQLREEVELLAAPPDAQLAWLRRERLPVDELALQLDDSVQIGWLDRLQQSGLLGERAVGELLALHAAVMNLLTDEHQQLWADEGLTESEWLGLRELAGRAVEAIGASGS
jgi:hypothetical protein